MASKGVNKVILVGTSGNDPDVRYMPNGNPCVHLSIATSETWNDKTTGVRQERTEWHRVVVFGKLAEIAGEFIRKGSQVYFEGRNQTREWEKDGVKRYMTEIIVDQRGEMQLLGGRPRREGEAPRQKAPRDQPAKPCGGITPPSQRLVTPAAEHPQNSPSDDPEFDSFDLDLNF